MAELGLPLGNTQWYCKSSFDTLCTVFRCFSNPAKLLNSRYHLQFWDLALEMRPTGEQLLVPRIIVERHGGSASLEARG